MCRPVVMQIWPWCRKEPHAPAEAAAATSASARMTSAGLPPSSRCARLRCRAASSPMRRPTAVEPVKLMIRTSGSVISASPTSGPPGSTCSRPSGRPASSKTRARTTPPDTLVRGSGLSTTALPSASAGATERMDRICGKLNGAITPTTPTGTRSAKLSRGFSLGSSSPTGREPGRLVDLLDGHVRLELSGRTDLAGLTNHPALDLGGVLLPEDGRPAQDRGALGVRRGRPGPLRLARLPDGARNVGRGRDADAAELMPGRGLDDGRGATFRGDPAVRVHLAVPGLVFEKCHDLLLAPSVDRLVTM